jgi:outer membrane protein assembly factor BamB
MKIRSCLVACLLVVVWWPDDRPLAQAGAVEMVPVQGEAAGYWTRWRGPSGQGVVADGGYPDKWSPTSNVVWRTAVPGRGNSSPIVWRDRIFITTAHDNGSRRSVLAYSRTDGRRVWETFVPVTGVSAHEKNGHASATPATDGERVYVSFGNVLVALDLDGAIVWRRDLGVSRPYHGPAGSPLLYGGRVILYQDQSPNAFVAAFDAKTGREVWRTPRDGSVGWGTPVAIHAGTRDEIVINGQYRVQAYDPETGRELWRCNGTTMEVIPTPVVGHGLVFASSGRAGPTLAIRPGGQGDVTGSRLVWSSPRGSPFVPSPLLYNGLLYTVNDMASIVTAVEATTGRTVWQGRLGVAQREGFSASPVAVNGKLFFTNDDGETFVVRAGRTFELLHVNSIGEPTLASPALVDGRWYIRTSQSLLAIGAAR